MRTLQPTSGMLINMIRANWGETKAGVVSVRFLCALALSLAIGTQICGADPLCFQTVPKGINNLGQVVGFCSDIAGTHGFVNTGGMYTYVNLPGSTFTIAYDINNNGQLLLFDNEHGASFLESAGQLSPISAPGIYSTGALGLNDHGQIVGANGYSGFLDTGGVFTPISFPGAWSTVATAINNSGIIVGTYSYVIGGLVQEHGFLYNQGIFTTIDVPGAVGTELSGVNEAGQIVGNVIGGPYRGFLFSGGQFTKIVPPGSADSVVSGINDSGAIIGSTGNSMGFLYTDGVFANIEAPTTVFTPEPRTLYTGMVGLGLIFLLTLTIKGHYNRSSPHLSGWRFHWLR
jgi:uncharacterized membrane protein